MFLKGKARFSVLILELACKHPCCTKLKREGVGWTVPVLTPHLLLFLQKKKMQCPYDERSALTEGKSNRKIDNS